MIAKMEKQQMSNAVARVQTKKTYILITDGLFTLNNDRFDL